MVQRITNEEIKTMGYTFLSVSNIEVGEPCFYFDAESQSLSTISDFS